MLEWTVYLHTVSGFPHVMSPPGRSWAGVLDTGNRFGFRTLDLD